MASTVTNNAQSIENAVKNATKQEKKNITTPVTHDEQHTPVILHNDTVAILGKMFTAQDDYENETKYQRVAMHSAVLGWAKAECRRIQNAWENAITKVNKLHPATSREDCEKLLLESKKNRETYAQVQVATSLLKDEFKS